MSIRNQLQKGINNMKEPKIITIDLGQYGVAGTIKQLPSAGFSRKQVTKSVKKPGRIKNAKGGMMKKKKKY